VKISSPDGQEIVYTSLDTNQPKTQASTVKTSSVPRKQESDGGPLLLQELTKERPAAPAPAPAPVARSSSEIKTAIVNVSMGYYESFEWCYTYIPKAEVFMVVSYNGKPSETIKLKPSDAFGRYIVEIPLSSTPITDELSSVKNYILNFFESEDEFLYEMELLTNQLVELEFITPNQVPWDEWLKKWKKVDDLKRLLAEKEAEYKDRFLEKTYDVNIYSYAKIYGSLYPSKEGAQSINQPGEYFNTIDLTNIETRISDIYFEPEYPKAAMQGTYQVSIELLNVKAGAYTEMLISGTDGYQAIWSYTHNKDEMTIKLYTKKDIPVAKKAGTKHEITVTYDNNSMSNPQRIKKRTGIIF
jgi:hypothetical protein